MNKKPLELLKTYITAVGIQKFQVCLSNQEIDWIAENIDFYVNERLGTVPDEKLQKEVEKLIELFIQIVINKRSQN